MDPYVIKENPKPKKKEETKVNNITITVDLTSVIREIGEQCLYIAQGTTFSLAEKYLDCVDKSIKELLKQSK